MKQNGIGFFEQNVEKLVLGLAAAALLGSVAWQFAGPEPTVELRSGEASIGDVYETIAQKAQRMRGQMEETQADTQTPTGAVDVVRDFRAKLDAPPVFGSLAAPLAMGPNMLSGESHIVDRKVRVTGVTIPAPNAPVAALYATTLSPLAVAKYPSLAQWVGAEQPYDVFAVSVEAELDAAALRKALETDPDGDGDRYQAVPSLWWSDKLYVAGVQIERQEMAEDGSFGAAVVLRSAAGHEGVDAAGLATPGEFRRMLRALRASPTQFARPLFYDTIAGDTWRRPAEVAEVVEPLAEGERLPVDPGIADRVPVWSHDMTAVPGTTYRYRVRITMPNPLHSYAQNLHDDSRELAVAPLLHSEWSAWSEPVALRNRRYWFVTQADDGKGGVLGVGEPWCEAEVFGFYYGYWRMASIRLRPGDALRGDFDISLLSNALYRWEIEDNGTLGDAMAIDAAASLDAGLVLLNVAPVAGHKRLRRDQKPPLQAVLGTIGADAQGVVTRQAARGGALRAALMESVEAGRDASIRLPIEAGGDTVSAAAAR